MKIKIKKIEIPIYLGILKIIYSKDWKYVNNKYEKKLDWDFPINEGYPACVFEDNTKEHTEYIASFIEKPTNKIIAHESIHLVNKIFRDRGIKIDYGNDEPQAYFMGWIFKEIEQFFKK